jgi:hypothetical protein
VSWPKGLSLFWGTGQAAPLILAAEGEPDGWIDDDGTVWRIAVDEQGIAYTYLEGEPLRLDEPPALCTCGHDRDDHGAGGPCLSMAGAFMKGGVTLCGCRAFEARP